MKSIDFPIDDINFCIPDNKNNKGQTEKMDRGTPKSYYST